MASITTVLRLDKLNASGKAPLHFRVIKNRKVTNISLSISIEPKFWDDKNKRVKKSYPNSKRLNNTINRKYLEVEEQLLKLDTKDASFDVKMKWLHVYVPYFISLENIETETLAYLGRKV